jgi:hypothetical protein
MGFRLSIMLVVVKAYVYFSCGGSLQWTLFGLKQRLDQRGNEFQLPVLQITPMLRSRVSNARSDQI